MSSFFQLRKNLEEKTLTSAEKKKREEIAQAIKRENPSMPMAKKMAIATATAKKVAEEAEQINEWKYTSHNKPEENIKIQLIKKKTTTVGSTHYGERGLKGATISKHREGSQHGERSGKYYATGGASTAITKHTTFHNTPEEAAAAYHKKYAKTMKEEVSLDEASTGKGNHRPGWMLKADPKLAQKFKEKREAYKARVKAYGNPAAGKSVKEESEQIDELKKSTVSSYIGKVVDPVYGIPKGGKETVKKRLAGLSRAHQRIVGHKPMTKE